MSYVYAITIEGLGDGSLDQLTRYATAAPAWDTDFVYVDVLNAPPAEIATEVDFRAGKASVGGLAFDLQETARVLGDLWTIIPTTLGNSLEALPTATPGDSDTLNTDVTDGSLANTLVFWGREALYIGAHNGSGNYDITRGMLGTSAPAHALGAGTNTALYAQMTDDLLDRQVKLVRASLEGGSYAAEETLWTGVLTNLTSQAGVLHAECDSALGLLERVKICKALWRGRRVSPGAFEASGSPAASSGLVDLSVDGKAARKKATYRQWGAGLTRAFLGAQLPTTWSAPLPSLEQLTAAWEFFRCTGEVGAESSLPLQRNVISLLLQLLTTTSRGDNYDSAGGATNYDVGVEDLGAGIDWRLVDVEGIERVRSDLGQLAYFDRNQLGFDGQAVDLADWIANRICKPLGLCLTVGSGGKLTLAQMLDDARPLSVSNTLREGDGYELIDTPDTASQVRRLHDPVDKVEVLWDDVLGVGPRTDTFEDVVARERRARTRTATDTLDLSGLGPNQEHLAQALAVNHLLRWRASHDECIVHGLGDTDLYTDAQALLTHRYIHGGAGSGARGVSELLCHVTGRRLMLDAGKIAFRLLQLGKVFTGQRGWIAPAAKVKAYDAGLKRIEVYPSTFQSGLHELTTDQDALDVAGAHTNFVLDHCSRNHAVLNSGVTVTSRSTVYLTHSGSALSPAPADGDLLKVTSYDAATDEQVRDFAFLAGDDEQLGAGGRVAYQWGS